MRSLTKTLQIVDKDTGQVLDEKVVTQQYRIEGKIQLTEPVNGYRYTVYPVGTQFDIWADSIEDLSMDDGDGPEYCSEDHAGVETVIPVSSAKLIKLECVSGNLDAMYLGHYFPATLPIEGS